MIREKVTWYLKALPKAMRNRLVPLPEAVTAFLAAAPSEAAPLPDALRAASGRVSASAAGRRLGTDRSTAAASLVNVRVVDAAGRELAAAAISRRCGRSSARRPSCRSRRPGPRWSGGAVRRGTSATFPRR